MSAPPPDPAPAGEPFAIEAPAKTNLVLRVLVRRDDGYHEIETLMVALSLADRLELSWRDDGRAVLECSAPELPCGEDNLVLKALRALERHLERRFAVTVRLEKRIPSGAGLGGGSSDAAALLLALDRMAGLQLPTDELAAVAAEVGSDVPFFVHRRPCLCRGRGEIVVPVETPPPPLDLLLVKPPFPIAASWAYRHWAGSKRYPGHPYDPQAGPWGVLENDLERPVFEKFPVLGDLKAWLLDRPEVAAALLSGSGSTLFAVLRPEGPGTEEGGRQALIAALRDRYGATFWTCFATTCP